MNHDQIQEASAHITSLSQEVQADKATYDKINAQIEELKTKRNALSVTILSKEKEMNTLIQSLAQPASEQKEGGKYGLGKGIEQIKEENTRASNRLKELANNRNGK